MNHLCKGDLVRVKPDFKSEYFKANQTRDCVGVIQTVFGAAGQQTEYQLYVHGHGEVRGFKKEDLEFLDQNHEATMHLWRKNDGQSQTF